MTAVDEARGPDLVQRRLSVLPTAVGLLGVVWALVGAWAVGVADGSRGGMVVTALAGLVLATVLSGSTAGLSAGSALLIGATLLTGDGPDRADLVVLVVTLVVVNETVRFSLDARRPSRFGPGLIAGHLGRALALVVVSVLFVVLLHPLAVGTGRSTGWIPVGLAAAGVPLLAPTVAGWLDRFPTSRAVRAGLGTVAAAGVVALAVLGADATDGLRGDADPEETRTAETAETPTTRPTVPELVAPPDGGASVDRRLLTVLLLGGATAAAVALYLALRRPAAVFALGEARIDEDGVGLGLATSGLARSRQEVEVADDDLARLLADLRIDLEAERDPARAIRYGYAAVERRLAELDLPRRGSETEREYLGRALARLGRRGGQAMADLTEVFERARFGTTEVGEDARRLALAAIDRLEGELDRPAPNEALRPGVATGGAVPDDGPATDGPAADRPAADASGDGGGDGSDDGRPAPAGTVVDQPEDDR